MLVLVAGFGLPVHVADAQGGLSAAVEWLRTQQGPDGGFSTGFSEGSDPGATADAILAIASAGEDPSTWTAEGTSPLTYLSTYAADIGSPGLAAKLVLAVVAAGQDPRQFGDLSLVELVLAGFDPATGLFGGGPYDSALCVLALLAVDEPLPAGSIPAMVAAMLPDGSYAFNGDMTPGGGDSNTTALVVQALLAAGEGAEVSPSFAYFRQNQNADGGWTYQKPSAFGEDTDANSTALVIQALLAGGQNLSEWGHPTRALEALQQPGGAFGFNAAMPGDNFLATVQAIPALAGFDLTDVPRLPAAFASRGVSSQMLLITTLVVIAAVLAASAILGGSKDTQT
ncbi:MAG: hypothetical protein A2Z17_05000 [Gammaproteobacteria bacterium RBG_16_66_13]|nr:MAG: hypothetical protein A2Z17_05000 [Gammaproteobacteria bacterium RBG_16_66_13]